MDGVTFSFFFHLGLFFHHVHAYDFFTKLRFLTTRFMTTLAFRASWAFLPPLSLLICCTTDCRLQASVPQCHAKAYSAKNEGINVSSIAQNIEGKVNGFQELVLGPIETCHQRSQPYYNGCTIRHNYKCIRTIWGINTRQPPIKEPDGINANHYVLRAYVAVSGLEARNLHSGTL